MKQTIASYLDSLKTGQRSAKDTVAACFSNIDAKNDTINAYVSLNKESALEAALEVDQKIAQGKHIGPLAGVPIAVKDNIVTTDMPTTCASYMLKNYVSQYEATVISKLRESGAIILGKTNMDEFAMGATTETSYFGVTKNPCDLAHVPGGSSGGSAAAVAADLCFAALGSDTGGSIRQPAAYCGIFGLKPTYGAISRYGLIAFASSLDQIGPMASNVTDLALIMNVLAGYDSQDSTSVNRNHMPYDGLLAAGVKGKRIGVPIEFLSDAVAPDVRAAVEKAADELSELGATVERCHLPGLEAAIPAYYLIATAEASSNLARFDGVRYGLREEASDVVSLFKKTRAQGFGAEVKRRIMLGTYALSAGYYDAYYLKALKVRRLIKEGFEKLFTEYDCLLTPTTVQVAPKLYENLSAVQMYQQDICTCPINLAGLPALSMPYGTSGHMPIGIQLIGHYWQEAQILGVANALDNRNREVK